MNNKKQFVVINPNSVYDAPAVKRDLEYKYGYIVIFASDVNNAVATPSLENYEKIKKELKL